MQNNVLLSALLSKNENAATVKVLIAIIDLIRFIKTPAKQL